MESPLLDIKEIAMYLKAGLDTAYTVVKSKGFPATKIGRDWKAPVHLIDKWIEIK